MVSNLKMFLVSNSTGPSRRLPRQARSRRRASTTKVKAVVALHDSKQGVHHQLIHRPRKNCRESILTAVVKL